MAPTKHPHVVYCQTESGEYVDSGHAFATGKDALNFVWAEVGVPWMIRYTHPADRSGFCQVDELSGPCEAL